MAYKDGVHVPDCLMEAAAAHWTVRIACRCGHEAFYDPHALWWFHERKGAGESFRAMRRRYYCARCYQRTGRRVRPAITAVDCREPTVHLEYPPEREWKRATQRFR